MRKEQKQEVINYKTSLYEALFRDGRSPQSGEQDSKQTIQKMLDQCQEVVAMREYRKVGESIQ